ncbi:MAG: GIY-YIG nuclease superfamily protein [Syntrophorhabdus sp. PtaU1.Bin002]|nr:MAG: GIY-YIG nuclease superfamily protein [Syntrophorhabdus sp. PtaB.Bin006]OPY65349.1 MAG: GIY-YIG nuclease superfamily protein [Syntrophorhabdus sp. PtaU1.Bin002]
MVKGKDGKIYTGISTDVSRRLDEHQACGTKGAKFLRGRGPLKLLIAMEVGSRSQALRVERRVKQLKRSRKENMIRQPAMLKVLIEKEVAARDEEASEYARR